jgi:hypothetical protein
LVLPDQHRRHRVVGRPVSPAFSASLRAQLFSKFDHGEERFAVDGAVPMHNFMTLSLRWKLLLASVFALGIGVGLLLLAD